MELIWRLLAISVRVRKLQMVNEVLKEEREGEGESEKNDYESGKQERRVK